MKVMNNLKNLNDYLFEALDRLLDDNLSEDDLKKEIERSKAVTGVATSIVETGRLALESVKHLSDWGYTENKKVTKLLGVDISEE